MSKKKIPFPKPEEVKQASRGQISWWYYNLSLPKTEEEVDIMKLVIKQNKKFKHDHTGNQGQSSRLAADGH